MGARDARRVGGNATARSDWGEKIERVWEVLVDSGGLRLPEEDDETPDSSEDDDATSAFKVRIAQQDCTFPDLSALWKLAPAAFPPLKLASPPPERRSSAPTVS